ncbi:hypothetical protein [Listeria booriae]|uniref:hypothetical protein n=1 Tax=Listeria booriae TaxID=1552123 RepID=UPI001629F042|nr:hypothetical protein [Listeria booriae]MBC2392014.1 hypothetical protein [Listeria booriae]
MSKLLYAGSVELDGKVIGEKGNLYEIETMAGGHMLLPKNTIQLIPNKKVSDDVPEEDSKAVKPKHKAKSKGKRAEEVKEDTKNV